MISCGKRREEKGKLSLKWKVFGGQDLETYLILLSSENVNGREVALGVAVLASLGSGHGGHLARVLLNADVPTHTDLASLHVEHMRGTGIARAEVVVIRRGHFF